MDANHLMMSCELRGKPSLLHSFCGCWTLRLPPGFGQSSLRCQKRIEFDLTADSAVELLSIVSLRLICSDRRSWRNLVATDRKDEFTWIATPDDWESYAALLEPFIEWEYGHQYLTDEVNDDLLVEVSFGERY